MRSSKHFLDTIHCKAAKIRRNDTRRQIISLTLCDTAVFILLVCRIGSPHSVGQAAFTGSSLLDEETGGLVALAVIAFMLGAAVTVFVRRRRK